MAYVERRDGAIIGAYAIGQPGSADEWLEDHDPEILAFLAPREPGPVELEPVRIACALSVRIADDTVQRIGGSYRVAGMMLLGTGTFLAIFSQNLGSEEPYIIPNNGVSVEISEWGGDYAMLEIRDHADGMLISPPAFGFSLFNF